MTHAQYQTSELMRFRREMNDKNRGYFATVKEFSESIHDPSWILAQLHHIECGNYGAGACLALQHVINSLSSRTNDVARVGRFALSCMFGRDFPYWRKLDKTAQESATKAVEQWLEQKRDFGMLLVG